MKKGFLQVLIAAVIIIGGSFAISAQKTAAKPKAPSISGVYENFTVGKESGDLEGMRIVLMNAGNEWHAVVQIAQGGAEDPKPDFVPVTVTGMKIEFKVGEMTYSGTVTLGGLEMKIEGGGTELVKRRACSSFL